MVTTVLTRFRSSMLSPRRVKTVFVPTSRLPAKRLSRVVGADTPMYLTNPFIAGTRHIPFYSITSVNCDHVTLSILQKGIFDMFRMILSIVSDVSSMLIDYFHAPGYVGIVLMVLSRAWRLLHEISMTFLAGCDPLELCGLEAQCMPLQVRDGIGLFDRRIAIFQFCPGIQELVIVIVVEEGVKPNEWTRVNGESLRRGRRLEC